jgi:serine/threonine protein kinase
MAPGKFVFQEAKSGKRLSFRPAKNMLNMKSVAEAFQLKNLLLQEDDKELVFVDLSEPYEIDLLAQRTGLYGTTASPYIVTGDPIQTGLASDAGTLFVEKIRKAGVTNIKQKIINRAIFYFSNQLQSVVMPSAPVHLAAKLYLQAAAQLGTNTRVNAVSKQKLSINGPLQNLSPNISTGVNLENGRPCLIKVLPTQEKQQADSQQAELLALQLLQLDSLPPNSCLVPTKKLVLTVSQEHALDLGLASNLGYDALQLPWYPASLNKLPKLTSEVIFRGAKCIEAALHSNHGKGLIHADVKEDNVFVDGKGLWHLGDYGSIVRIGDPVWSCTRVSPKEQLVFGSQLVDD